MYIIQQQLTAMREEVLYEVLIDLKKAYVTLDQERRLYILVVYGVGPRAELLLWK